MAEHGIDRSTAPPGPQEPPGPPPKKGAFGKVVTTIIVLGLVGGGTYTYRVRSLNGGDLPAVNEVTPASARQQSTLVDQEDTRIMQVRANHESRLADGGTLAAQVRQPYTASSANGRTFVLPQRREPYYVAELESKRVLERQADGSYLLTTSILAVEGAKLVLQNASGPLTIRLRSVPGSFTSIVGFGAGIRVNGSAQNPVRFTSWNEDTRRPDTEVSDGRAYIRAIGGEFSMTYTQVSDLGFWSGRTGGLALTGSDRPGSAAEPVGAPSVPRAIRLPSGERDTNSGGREEIEVGAPTGGGRTTYYVPQANLVSGVIDHTTVTGNAYGLFVTAANQTQLTNNTISGSLVHGVLLHRFAKNTVIENTTVRGSRGDGFVLSRGTEGVRITGCAAERNGGNGFTLNGEPLAAGPSASGESITAFGGNLISGSAARGNRRYGVELVGGDNAAVQNTRITGGDMGIVVRSGATRVQISGNQVSGPDRQGIVLRDGVTGATVAGNVVTGAETALYLRRATGTLIGNTVQSASRHGVTLTGAVAGTRVTGNTIGGTGTSALDVRRATGGHTVTGNNVHAWRTTAGFGTWVGRALKPMNLIWASVFLLVAVSVYRSRDAEMRIGRHGAHPYEKQRRLEERPVRVLRRARPEPSPNGHTLPDGEPVGAFAERTGGT
ncbi:right-handed parallel beta-helix repeat-containing protein [Actinomadura sp. SCN-SB]|uniref:right-handed parallel beta-helix repeat-containing protein n=1 Tax=Actinomadura sp. SCN-SB TaxID=3373092 RepID=UPI0037515BC0